MREATEEEIGQVDGFGPRQAREVWDFFHGSRSEGAAPDGPPGASEAEIDAALAEEVVQGEASPSALPDGTE